MANPTGCISLSSTSDAAEVYVLVMLMIPHPDLAVHVLLLWRAVNFEAYFPWYSLKSTPGMV
jgi:hypothetical protein